MPLYKPQVITCAYCNTGAMKTGLDGKEYQFIPCQCGRMVLYRVLEAVGIQKANCDTCVHIEDVGDGIEYGGPCLICNKPGRTHVSNLRSFPFKKDQVCYTPNFWHSKFAKMIKHGEDDEVNALDQQFRKAVEKARKET